MASMTVASRRRTADPPEPDRVSLVDGVLYQQAGQLHEAEAVYKAILKADPTNVDAWYLLAVLARQAEQPDIAARWMRRAIALDGRVAQFHNHLGGALLETGDLAEAERCFVRALQLKPRYIDAMLNLATLLVRLGRDAEAVTCYEAVLRLKPDHAVAKSSLDLVRRHLAA